MDWLPTAPALRVAGLVQGNEDAAMVGEMARIAALLARLSAGQTRQSVR